MTAPEPPRSPQPPRRHPLSLWLLVAAFVLVLVISLPGVAESASDRALSIGAGVGLAGVAWSLLREYRRR
ncbi:hypothetical protein G7070_11475 [Propioniciclava coleopterorum]|uniref:Uncharacterized protein n=1 Tax=Propioniciclava coleopterorum TaxID=2714937 RepID=A0A6G7Y7L9_9ACTN|nr:hypothetical protein [Propioniciclava coleopterorum]QIK72780.1 hypothetical protein G7070_11475 [Propioniciclava coleopterorum]